MENVQETATEQKELNENAEEIIKPDHELQQKQQQEEEENKIQQQQHQEEQHEEQELDLAEPQQGEEPGQNQQPETEENQLETPTPPAAIEKQPTEPPTIAYEEHNNEEEEDDEDDDEEKETSQKLVIDIPDEEDEEDEEEEEEEKEVEEEEDNDVIALDDLPAEIIKPKESKKVSPKPEIVDAIITLSDGEEDVPANEATSKPGKVQKRRSMGAGSVAASQDEERYRLKRRKINVAGAPKMPLTGYVRYMNDRRDSLRKEHPTKTAMEHTKMIGEEWHALPSDVKATYLKAADVDKQRYVKELHSFLKSRPDILASELAKNKIRKTGENNSPNPSSANAQAAGNSTANKPVLKDKTQITETAAKTSKDNSGKDKMSKDNLNTASTSQQASEKASVNEKNKRKRTPTPPTSTTATNNTNTTNANASTSATAASSSSNITSTIVTPTPGEIPIFTNEFLEHNKIYDMELRSLRKSKTDLEQQNSVLEKHVENMKFGVEKMITENNELEEKNRLLEIYLDKLKRKLALALGGLPLPSAPNGATVDNIDKYMQDLYKMSTSNSHGPATLNKAKDIIRKLDLQIQL